MSRFFPNYGYADPLSSLRSCHLDIKDAQCATKKLGVKYHFTSCRVWALRSFKSGVLGSQQFNFFRIGQICRVDRNWFGAHFLLEWFLCAILIFFRFDRFCIYFLRDLAEIRRFFFLGGWLCSTAPPTGAPPLGPRRYRIDILVGAG